MAHEKDVFVEISKEMLHVLMEGQEVKIEQPDGSQWHFRLSRDLGWFRIIDAISGSIAQAVIKSKDASSHKD